MSPRLKRMALIATASGAGGAVGWLYYLVIKSCDGSCVVGAEPWFVSGLLAMVGAYSAVVATRPQPN